MFINNEKFVLRKSRKNEEYTIATAFGLAVGRAAFTITFLLATLQVPANSNDSLRYG